jgi:hypothetical protein
MFFILKLCESRTKTDINSRWAKDVCYGGLSLLGVIGITSTEVSIYVAAMCFVECVDLCFN